METAIQVLLFIVLIPMALGILLFILAGIRDVREEYNRKYHNDR